MTSCLFAVKVWISKGLFFEPLPGKYIAIRGFICRIEIHMYTSSKGISYFDILQFAYIRYTFEDKIQEIQKCPNYKLCEMINGWAYCPYGKDDDCAMIKFINKNIQKTYYVLRSRKARSWVDTQQLCKNLNASLPQLVTEDRMDEFKAILMGQRSIPELIVIPIGLKYNNNTVSRVDGTMVAVAVLVGMCSTRGGSWGNVHYFLL